MKAIRIIIHTFALLAGLLLILDLPFISELKQILLYIIIAYSLSNLVIYLMMDLLALTLPRFTGISLVYAFMVYQHFFGKNAFVEQTVSTNYILWFSIFFPAFLLLNNILGIPVWFKFKKKDISAFRKYYILNIFVYFLLIIIFVFISYLLENERNQSFYSRIIAIFSALYPFLNKQFFLGLYRRYQSGINREGFNMDFGLLGKLGLVRNFVFAKDKIISTGKYQLTESDYRSTIRVSTALALSRYLAEQWNPKYTSLFVRDEYEKLDVKFQIVEKNENGISVINDDATMYHFGNSAYLKNKTHKDDHSNLFLIKNEIPIAKFKINEKIEPEKVEFFNELDYYGNILLLNNGNLEDLGHDYTIIFDKIYSGINETKQFDILKELEKKAPTAFFSAKQHIDVPNSVFFYITSKIDAKPIENQIILASQDLRKIPGIVRTAKKVHSLSKYALFFLFFSQLFMAVFAIFGYQFPALISSISLLIALLSEIFARYVIKQVDQLPSQPANLAHNHHAA